MLIRKRFQSKFKLKKEMPGQLMSTPNGSETEVVTPDISIIEPTYSVPTIISTESVENLETFDKIHACHMHPAVGAEIVQRAGHCTLPSYLTPYAIGRRLGLGKRAEPSQGPNTDPTDIRLTEELQEPIINSKPQVETSPTIVGRPVSFEEFYPPNLTKSNVVTRKLAKSSSPFKESFALQTFQTSTKETSPLQSLTNTSKTTIGVQDPNSNLLCPETPRVARSCPSTPRDTAQSWGNTRSKSKSPPPNDQEPTTANERRLTTTLKDIIGRITSTFATAESKSPDYSCTECTQSRVASKPIPRGVHFIPQELIAAGGKTQRHVQELYFNKDILSDVQSSHDPYNKQELSSVTYPPWVQVARPFSKMENLQTPKLSNLVCQCQSPLSSNLGPCKCFKKTSTSSQPSMLSGTLPQSSKTLIPTRPQTAPASPLRSSFRPQQPIQPQSPASFVPPSQHKSYLPYELQERRPALHSPLQQSVPTQPYPPQPFQTQPRLPQPHQPLPQPGLTAQPYTTDTGLSGSDSAGSLQNKLIATQRCLKNKEETVRVQSESLACAEQRIAMLTLRAAQQRCELENLQRELHKQRGEENISYCDGPSYTCCNADVCCQSEDAEVEKQKIVVKTLQDNLSVIEELYRECFYETAKQEELIDKLRKSYLDVRLMEKEKADRIGRLEDVINAQKWSLETCQGVALEVENLKMEITNFLNTSNNDSGVWEQSLAGEMGEDINDIMQQLHQLREILQGECIDTCTLQRENQNLRDLNRNLECKIAALGEDKCQLEATIREKEDAIICLRREKDELCCEMRGLRTDLEAAQKRVSDLDNENDCVRKQLKEAQAEVGETKSEIGFVRGENEELRKKNTSLAEEIEKADLIIKENLKIRSSVSYLTQQVALWRQQLAESEERVRCVEAELARARSHCRNVDQCYKEKAEAVEALEVQLQEAHARGAQLCAESRRVVCTVRNWIRRMQATNKEQSQTIKDQESCIAQLEEMLREEKRQRQQQQQERRSRRCKPCPERPRTPPCQFADYNYTGYCTQEHPSDHHVAPQYPIGCSKCAAQRPADPERSPDDSDDVIVGCSKCAPKRTAAARGFRPVITADYQVGCSKCAPNLMTKQRLDDSTESGSGSLSHTGAACGCERESNSAPAASVRAETADEAASCSHIPVPPRRLLRKRLYSDRVAHFLRCTARGGREAGVQEPMRTDSATSPRAAPPVHSPPRRACAPDSGPSRIPRAVSPTSELLERVSNLSDAMADSQRRWSRTKLAQPQRDRR